MAAFVARFFLALLLEIIGTYNIFIGILVALVVGIGFVLTIGFYDVSYENKNIKVYLIDAGYHIVALIIAGLILGFWQI
ncbi:MAG: DUF1761 domain-containing protein [Candidatus Hodarchaeota archaeon]